MIVGAPLMAALARRWPARTSLLGFVLAFAVAHVVGALTTSFAVLLGTRVVAALANAGFLAVALSTAATLVAADRKGRALAVLLSGTTVAIIAGVPGGALLGMLLGWRATFWAIALLCLPAAGGVVMGLPARVATSPRGAPVGSSLRGEIAQLARPRLILVMLVGALVNAATFATFTFLAPIVTGTAGLGELWVPVVLVLFGAGALVGVTLAGRLSDRRPGVVLAVGGPALLLGWFGTRDPGRPAGGVAAPRVRAGRALLRAGQHPDRPSALRGGRRTHDGRVVRDRGAQHRCRRWPCHCRLDPRGRRPRSGLGQLFPGWRSPCSSSCRSGVSGQPAFASRLRSRPSGRRRRAARPGSARVARRRCCGDAVTVTLHGHRHGVEPGPVVADVGGGAQQPGQVLVEQRSTEVSAACTVTLMRGHHPAVAVAYAGGDRPDAGGQVLVGQGPALRAHLAQHARPARRAGLPAGVMPERLGLGEHGGRARPAGRAASSTLPIEVAAAGKRVPMVTASVTILGTATRAT